MDCNNFCKSVQSYLTQTKSSLYDSWVIDLSILKFNMTPTSTQFRDWIQITASTLDKAISFDGFTPFSYVGIENDGCIDHMKFAQDTKFVNRCKTVSRLEGKHFDEDNQRFYTSLCVAFIQCGFRYCYKHEIKKRTFILERPSILILWVNQ